MAVPPAFGIISASRLTTTWSATDKNAKVTLSGGNLIAARSDLTGDSFATVRASTSRSSGKWYFEITVNTGSSASTLALGLARSALSVSGILGFGDSIGALNSGGADYGVWFGSANVVATPNATNYGAPNVVQIAVDLDNERFWYRVNGGAWSAFGGGTGNPATGAGATSFASLTGPYFPAATLRNAAATQVTANFGASAFSGAIPSGYTAWNG